MELILKNRPDADGRIDARRVAVLAVHWQNDLVRPEGKFGPIFAASVARQALLPKMADVLRAVRSVGATVIYVNIAHSRGHRDVTENSALFRTSSKVGAFTRGTWGVAVVDELRPQDGDYQVEHPKISAFFASELDMVLRARDIQTVAIAGMATNVAVDHTVRDALQLGYDTILLEDCCCSSDAEFHDAALKTLRVLATWVTPAEGFVARLAPDREFRGENP